MNEKGKNLVKSLYKDESGNPIEMTLGQQQIFEIISTRKYPRVQCISYTQYGKSLITALAVLTRGSTFPEKWAIVAPSNKKAKIIMGYVIDHIFDNEYTALKFDFDKTENREKIRRERSKERINFRISEGRLGEIFILSTEAKRTKDVLDALMGFGSPNVILDESALIDDEQYAGVKRMLGGHKDNFLFEIGNPFRRNHFYRTSRDSNYHHLLIDWEQGVREGRITADFINEMKKEAMFPILYECKFPPADAIDSRGYSPLLVEQDLDRAYLEDVQLFGELRLGCDVAGGGSNYSVVVLRGDNGAKILYREQLSDTMTLVGIILRFIADYKIKPENVFIDKIGVGKGAYDRLNEQMPGVVAVNVGERPEDEEDFTNLRSQAYWRMSEWVKSGGKIKKDIAWEELLSTRYKVQSDKKVKLMSKDEMLKEGIESPDVADALMLTFTQKPKSKEKVWKQPEWQPISEFEGR